ncbi:hypothetical protein NAL32_14535 [Chryseobacterium sp. Ch-15]|uniref:Lipoprotein n=1 Tax=Chryseobacterium muglaense TaxID=2893752 RepID=A0A9Q3US83_9FLAO|nr:hypothetical protein [Chryseobacterium muglaense]MBD3905661.1 hypothetical protein [Chryseobacterium muglaense]MCC9034189.1 hypothetical protein [Chryseobacterium muglaense]MCM2555598.1 hypothetical protein [Chryseobacterium muglaense]
MTKIIPLFLFLAIISCIDKKQSNTLNDNKKEHQVNSLPKTKHGKLFFDYNELDHYYIDTSDSTVLSLYNSQDKSKTDKIRYEVIVGETPNNITDQEFLKFIKKIGYSKNEVDSTKFKALNKIFVEKPEEDMEARACSPVYRDILIFKKDKKVNGIVKICFNCHQYRIFGTNANTQNFGSNTDYFQLKDLLK